MIHTRTHINGTMEPIVLENNQKLKEFWDWIDFPRTEDWWRAAGKYRGIHVKTQFDEIPESVKPTARFLVTIAYNYYKMHGHGSPCILFRSLLYAIHKELDKKDEKIILPYMWYCDGVMIEPELIVKITNGIIGWTCDESVEHCGGR